MWRDLWLYLRALIHHWSTFATGTVVSLILLLWQDVLKREGIPTWALWIGATFCFFVAGFKAWREEHAKVGPAVSDPETELRRPEFEKALAKLTPRQALALYHVVQHGDRIAGELRQFLNEQGEQLDSHDADILLTSLADAGLLEARTRGLAYNRYGVKPAWQTSTADSPSRSAWDTTRRPTASW